MARVITFYIPDTFKPKSKGLLSGEIGRVIQFPRSEAKKYVQSTWIFPEVDADLSLREG